MRCACGHPEGGHAPSDLEVECLFFECSCVEYREARDKGLGYV